MTDHYERARPHQWALDELPSLTGKIALVTGANSPDSIGWHIAYNLALKGAKVYVGARSTEKAQSAIQAMVALSPDALPAGTLRPFVADLGNFRQVKEAAKEFISMENRLDILVNNAGILPRKLEFDSYGINISFSTNHLGPFLLTTTLLPLIIKTSSVNPDVRIVNVASTAALDAPESVAYTSVDEINADFGSEDEPLANYTRYGMTKLANVLFTSELQRRLSSIPITSSDPAAATILAMSLHPGGVATTGAIEYQGGPDSFVKGDSVTPFEGAITPLFAAAHPEPRENEKTFRGKFLLPWGGVKEVEKWNGDEAEKKARELWALSEKILEDIFSDTDRQ
ncbi:NAD-P-binding protein [Dendryphion nanum]|uniref:NAD-P-binding protein n=1 Tax=Dendryphion nanum TaxID=256645 RepID=A0A9P9D7U9_9PLEO|nr:NAD-P-binding protein [Dendryphion nanum]